MNIERPRVVVFGAGNIGRSFIAPVFTKCGYEVVFADVSPKILEALVQRDHYTLIEKSDAGEILHDISPVSGIDAGDSSAVRMALEGCDICVCCVGAGVLPGVLKTIGNAVVNRRRPINVILAENLLGAGDLARRMMIEAGMTDSEITHRIGIIETSIGKMVPNMPKDASKADPLLCWAEPYNTLVVDADGFIGEIPNIPNIKAVSPIAPWVARKLYIHNFGHAAAAYLGHLSHPDMVFLWEVLEDTEVFCKVEAGMRSMGKGVVLEYPEVFNGVEIEEHIQDLLFRFRNRALGDTVYRVGRDLARKLRREDRVVGAVSMLLKHGLDPGPALGVFAAALRFSAFNSNDCPEEPDAAVRKILETPKAFLNEVTGITQAANPQLFAVLLSVIEKTR